MDTINVSVYKSVIGDILLGAGLHGLCISMFTDDGLIEERIKYSGIEKKFKVVVNNSSDSYIESAKSDLEEYFNGKLRKFNTKLFYHEGTHFQIRVWNLLKSIPFGKRVSYYELARKTGNAKSVRAVAQAIASNRISIFIPCHRVINKNGKLGGYSGGIWRKAQLLELEQK